MSTSRTRPSTFGTFRGGFPELQPVFAGRKAVIVEQQVALLELQAVIVRQEMDFPELQTAIVELEPELLAFAETLCVLEVDIAPREVAITLGPSPVRGGIFVETTCPELSVAP